MLFRYLPHKSLAQNVTKNFTVKSHTHIAVIVMRREYRPKCFAINIKIQIGNVATKSLKFLPCVPILKNRKVFVLVKLVIVLIASLP